MKLKTWLTLLIFIICSLVNLQPVSAATGPVITAAVSQVYVQPYPNSYVTITGSISNNGSPVTNTSFTASLQTGTISGLLQTNSSGNFSINCYPKSTSQTDILTISYGGSQYQLNVGIGQVGVTFSSVPNGAQLESYKNTNITWVGPNHLDSPDGNWYTGSCMLLPLNSGLSFDFTGTSINIIGGLDSSEAHNQGGIVQYIIDGVKYIVEVPTYSYVVPSVSVLNITGLNNGIHSLSLSVINQLGTNFGYGFDAFFIDSGASVLPYTPAPSQPTISVSTGMDSYPDIIYNWVSGATSEYLYRNGTQIATLPNTGSVYEDMSLSTPGTYQYYIVAANVGGTVASNVVSYTFNVSLTKSSPLGGIINNNQLNLEWLPPQGATSYSIIDNGQPIVTDIPSTVTSYNLSSMQPGSNKLYLQAITATGYSASNIVDVDNVIPSKSLDYTFLAYNANKTGFISFFDGVFTKYLDNNSQNIILYPQNTTVCQSAS